MGTSSQIGYLRDMIKCKLFFANNFERTGVWSAFCYCTFEEGPAIYCGRCPRSTQKMHIRELEYVPHRAEVHKNALLLVYSL